MTTTSVVISAYTNDRWPDIEAGIRALAQQSLQPDRVVYVVDNNRELSDRVRSVGKEVLPNLDVLDFRGGLSAARNLGVEVSNTEVIAFLDDDACPDIDWLRELVAPFGMDDHVMMTGGTINPGWPDGTPPAWFPEEFLWVVGATYGGMDLQAELRNPLGASMAVRKVAWEVVGGFTTSIGLGADVVAGCEETDFSVRLVAAMPSARIRLASASRVTHRVTPERATVRYFCRRCRVEGRSKAYFLLRNGQGALGPERGHATKTIPRAIGARCRAVARGDFDGLKTIGVSALGLSLSTAAFAVEALRLRRRYGSWSLAATAPDTTIPVGQWT